MAVLQVPEGPCGMCTSSEAVPSYEAADFQHLCCTAAQDVSGILLIEWLFEAISDEATPLQ